MALQKEELFSSATKSRDLRFDPKVIQPRKFDGVTGGPTLPKGTAVGRITTGGLWVKWTNAAADGSEVIKGFLLEDAVLHDTNETLHNVMLAGHVHRDDVPLNGETQGNLDAALSTLAMRDLGFYIQGLPNLP